MPTVSCPDCGATLRLPESAAGKAGRCPRCQTLITVPPAPPPDDAPIEVVEDEPTAGEREGPRAAAEQPPAKPKTKGKGKKKGKKTPAAGPGRARVRLIAGGAVGLAVLLGAVVIWWATRSPDKPGGGSPGEATTAGPNGGPNTDPVQAAPEWPVAVGPARPPKTGVTAGLLDVQPVEAIDWSVAADPPPTGEPLAAAFPVPRPFGAAHLLSGAPGSGRVALVGRGTDRTIHLVRYDLRKSPFPLGSAELQKPPAGDPASYSLSPDGERVAILMYGGEVPYVWEADGKPAPRLVRPKDYIPYSWVGFTAADRLTGVMEDGRALEYDVTTAKLTAERQLGIKVKAGTTVVSAGGRYFAAATADGFAWFRLPGWEPAGRMRLPQGLPPGLPEPAAAVSPDGATFAAYYQVPHTLNSVGWHAVLTWDVATGAFKEALRLPGWRFWNNRLPDGRGVRWVGPRQLLLANAHLIDLDLREQIAGVASSPFAEGPDARLWQLATLEPDAAQAAWAKLTAGRPAPIPETRLFLTANTPPVATLKARMAVPAKLDRGRPVRAEASCADEVTRKRLAEGFAFVLSENGFTVDPTAPVALRLTFKPAELRVASVAAVVTATSAMNTDARQAYVSTAARVQLVDANGKVVWTGDSLTGTTNVGGQVGKAQAATDYGDAAGPLGTPATSGIEAKYPAEVAKAQTSILPKLTRELFGCFPGRIEPEVLGFAADGRPVRLPPVLWPGADGVTEARIEDQK